MVCARRSLRLPTSSGLRHLGGTSRPQRSESAIASLSYECPQCSGIAVADRGSYRAGRHRRIAQQEGGLVEAYLLNEMQWRHADDGGCRTLQRPFTNAQIASGIRDPERSR